METKKREGDDKLLQSSAPNAKRQCPKEIESMRWPCTLYYDEESDAILDGLESDNLPWREISFSIRRSDLVLQAPPALIRTVDDDGIADPPATGVMYSSKRNDKVFLFGGFTVCDFTEPTECVHAAKAHLNSSCCFGDSVQKSLLEVVDAKLGISDRPPTQDPALSDFFASHNICRHMVPMLDDTTYPSAYLDLFLARYSYGRISVQIVDDSGEPIMSDGYMLLLALEQALKQPATMHLRQYFERHLRYCEKDLLTKERSDYIMDASNLEIVVGDLISVASSDQRIMPIKWSTDEHSRLKVMLDHESEMILLANE